MDRHNHIICNHPPDKIPIITCPLHYASMPSTISISARRIDNVSTNLYRSILVELDLVLEIVLFPVYQSMYYVISIVGINEIHLNGTRKDFDEIRIIGNLILSLEFPMNRCRWSVCGGT